MKNMYKQLSLFTQPKPAETPENIYERINKFYDHILVMFSGGKDSWASLLHLLENATPEAKKKIEIWHHLVDGREGSTLMDWPCTEEYVIASAKALDLPIFMSWKEGGFEREMCRDNQPTAPIWFEALINNEKVLVKSGGNSSKTGTRRKFPMITADLTRRWCSSYLKIQVAEAALRNQMRFRGSSTLVITGERAEESPGRGKYQEFQNHSADLRDGKAYQRHIDHWRPVHKWTESEVWSIMEKWKINPHPAYKLGWGRVSCRHCIFGSNNQFSSGNLIDPDGINLISQYEEDFAYTMHSSMSVDQRVSIGTPYKSISQKELKTAMSKSYKEPIFIDKWVLPAGAYGENCGPR